MSLEPRSIHVRIDPEQHRELSALATARNSDMAGLAAELLEKAIHGEYLQLQRTAERIRSLGMMREPEGLPSPRDRNRTK